MFARQQVVGGFDLKPAEIKAAAALDCDMGDPAGEHDNGNQEKAVDWSADRTAKPRRRQYGGERDYDQRQGEQAFGLPGKRVQERMARAKGAVEGHEDQAMRDQRTDRGNQQDGHAPRATPAPRQASRGSKTRSWALRVMFYICAPPARSTGLQSGWT
jgi:hypothetical protein